MDRQLEVEITDLPVECVEQILSKITDREHRMYARFVCKLWCSLIDRDCSSEHYVIDLPPIRSPSTPSEIELWYRYLRKNNEVGYWSEQFFPLFVNSQRRKLNFRFERVDFENSEQFWKQKGVDIVSLHFARNCQNIQISLIEITEHCDHLRNLTIEFCSRYNPIGYIIEREQYIMEQEQLKDGLENCVSDGRTNLSVRIINLKKLISDTVDDIIQLVLLVSRVFLGVRNLVLEVDENLKSFIDLKSLRTAFEDLKFHIELSYRREKFVFHPSGQVPETERIKCLSMKMNNDHTTGNMDILSLLSRYSCDRNHLNKLYIDSGNQCYNLEQLNDIIAKCPSFRSLYIAYEDGSTPKPPKWLLRKNNIECLHFRVGNFNSSPDNESYDNISFLVNNIMFLLAFENLKTFNCHNLFYSDFVLLCDNLRCLEVLKINYGKIDVQPKQKFVNNKLIELRLPQSFLVRTTTKYEFKNVKNLHLATSSDVEYKDISFEPQLDIFNRVKYVNCPKLQILQLDFDEDRWDIEKDEYTEWLVQILSLFPTLVEFTFGSDGVIVENLGFETLRHINNNTLTTILKHHPRLKKIGNYNNPHYLTLISPSLFRHRCEIKECILHIG